MTICAVAAGFVFGFHLIRHLPGTDTRPATAALHSPASARNGGTQLDPATFAIGSCVAFAPTRGNDHRTVFLDAGHGGLDPGATGTTESGLVIHEANETLPVELDVMRLLRAHGFRVVVSRTRASTVTRLEAGDLSERLFTIQGAHRDVAARDICANLAKANILLGIYFDAGASPQNAGSVTAYDADRPFARASRRLAELVQRDVLRNLNSRGFDVPNGGVKSDATLGGIALSSAATAYDHLLLLGPAKAGYFSTPSTMPGALIEPLFITDPFEASVAGNASDQRLIAQGLAKAVEQYFGSS